MSGCIPQTLTLAVVGPLVKYYFVPVVGPTCVQRGRRRGHYTVSITYFVLRFCEKKIMFCERFFKTRSITHVKDTNILYIYSNLCTRWYGDAAELIVDLLAHEINGYRRFLSADINTVKFVSL